VTFHGYDGDAAGGIEVGLPLKISANDEDEKGKNEKMLKS